MNETDRFLLKLALVLLALLVVTAFGFWRTDHLTQQLEQRVEQLERAATTEETKP